MQKYFTLLIPTIAWIAVVIFSLYININVITTNTLHTVKSVGEAFFREIETTRLWNARHGGVYVPVTDNTKPNPYLNVPNRDIQSTTGIELTKVNPAYMTRQIADIAKSESKIQYHITSLKPIRPKNKATEWEAKALKAFEAGSTNDFLEFFSAENVYRYMAPLPTKAACLKCHAKQGYKVGDVRGGISVTIDAKPYLAAETKAKNSLYLIHLIVMIIGVVAYYLFWRYREHQLDILNSKNAEIESKNQQLTDTNVELHNKNQEVLEAKNIIIDSIQYAQRIQSALLSKIKRFEERIPDSFFIWQPKDIVGGDIFHTSVQENSIIISIIDCTGHGVSGALMTMLASSGLDRAMFTPSGTDHTIDTDSQDAAQILQKLNVIIKDTLDQHASIDESDSESDDGLDAAVCIINLKDKVLTYAGARLPLYLSIGDDIKVIKGDKQSVGYRHSILDFNFTNHKIEIASGMTFYCSTDGYIDQVGGAKKLPFGNKKFAKLLKANLLLPMKEQKQLLLETFKDHKGDLEQRDDVTIIGFKIP